MSKVTRVSQSKHLNQGKYERLSEMARRLGYVRADLWRRYGSISGVGLHYGVVAKARKGQNAELGLTYKLWKNTLKDVVEDIATYRAAAKVSIKGAIRSRSKDEDARKQLYTALKYDRWQEDAFLRRHMRKHYRHGRTRVNNQIILEPAMYTSFERAGVVWLKVQSLERGQRIAIPTNAHQIFTGNLRLILRDGIVEIHYSCDAQVACSTRPCGDAVIGIDKGYTEVFTDSDGERHGEGLGKLLSDESDYLKEKYKRRNKLKNIADKKPHKREAIYGNNLGRKRLNRRRKTHKQRVRDTVYQATHSMVDKAETIACEDLTSPIKDNKKYGKNQSRRLSAWVKGTMAEALESVTQRRGSALSYQNCAYTSQMDSRHGILMGERRGDSFYCEDGDVLDADWNAAQNILARMDDDEIHRYMPYQQVKVVLLERTAQFKQRLGPLNHGSSCNEPI